MKKMKNYHIILVYILVLGVLIGIAYGSSKAVTVLSEKNPFTAENTIIIDAGHGDPDGGTTSCTGITESVINLEIAMRLDDLMHLLGINTIMTRKNAQSIYTEGESIAKKKVSDLKNRVNLINNTKNPILVSIHQNYFQDGRYSGAQVFYNRNENSKQLAAYMQKEFISTLNSGSNRQPKIGQGIYLLEHINCTGILVECGFLSNPQEEYILRTEAYQKKVCCVIAACISSYLYA